MIREDVPGGIDDKAGARAFARNALVSIALPPARVSAGSPRTAVSTVTMAVFRCSAIGAKSIDPAAGGALTAGADPAAVTTTGGALVIGRGNNAVGPAAPRGIGIMPSRKLVTTRSPMNGNIAAPHNHSDSMRPGTRLPSGRDAKRLGLVELRAGFRARRRRTPVFLLTEPAPCRRAT